jgi:hypothetical protein
VDLEASAWTLTTTLARPRRLTVTAGWPTAALLVCHRLGRLVGFPTRGCTQGGAGSSFRVVWCRFGFADIEGEAGGVLNDEDLGLVAETLAADSTAALVVWEHRWAARVAQAIRDAGGRIIAGERVPDEIVEQALADLATD